MNIPTANNNPGDLRGQGGSFNIGTTTPLAGQAALYNDLTAKMTGQSKTGVNGNSTLYQFAQTYDPKGDGNNDPVNYTAKLANQLGISPDTKIGTLLPRIDDFAKAVANNEGYQGQWAGSTNTKSGGFNPKPYSNPTSSNPGQFDVSGANPPPVAPAPTQPESTLQKVGDVAKGVGNFLFPVVSDVINDIKGTSQKSFLQQVGDTALSALPFIPGLGEAGEAARGTEAAVEGGEAVAKGLPALSDLLGKTGATVAKGAAVGYGTGVASNLSQGQGLGQAFAPQLSNLLGAGLGAATPLALKGLGALGTKFSGISPQIQKALQDSGISVADYDKYIDSAKANAADVRAPAPLSLAADEMDKASGKIDQNLSQAGKAVGMAKSGLGEVKLPDISNVGQDFGNRVAKDYGLQIVQDEQGVVHAVPMTNRTPSIAPTEISRIEKVAQNLVNLQGSTALNGTDVISNLDHSINYAKAANNGFDPISSLLLSARSGVDDSVRSVAPDLAAANDRYSQLADLQREVKKMAGGQNQRGELLMRRIFSGDKSGDVQDLFNKIKGETGIDLVNHAALAKHAIETVGSKTQKTLLEQAIEGGVEAHTGGLLSGGLKMATGVARNIIANPESTGRNIVAGGSSGLLKGLTTKGAIESSRLPGMASLIKK